MTALQLWKTTMDPERRTLLSVRLEDMAECETIFTTLMGEEIEARRKFIVFFGGKRVARRDVPTGHKPRN
jgi:DNA gyrase/topoisomerase IV subunit B